MTVTQLDHLNLSVDDFDDTARWYGRVFGFPGVEEGIQDGTRWGVLRAGAALLCIYERPERQMVDRWALDRTKKHGFNHFALRIEDRESWLRTLDNEGLELLYGGEITWPHSAAWYVKDPTGYEIEVALWDEGRPMFSGC